MDEASAASTGPTNSTPSPNASPSGSTARRLMSTKTTAIKMPILAISRRESAAPPLPLATKRLASQRSANQFLTDVKEGYPFAFLAVEACFKAIVGSSDCPRLDKGFQGLKSFRQ